MANTAALRVDDTEMHAAAEDGTEQIDELDRHKRAFEKAKTVCLRAADGDFEARITDIEEFGELTELFNAINLLLDRTDAFVREAGTSLEYASQRKYFRPFLLRGMLGDFRRGAQTINSARENMERRHNLTEEFLSTVSSVVDVVSQAASELEGNAHQVSSDAGAVHDQSLAVSAASEEATASAQSVAASADELSSAIGEISQQIAESTAATQSAVGDVASAQEAVDGLVEAAQEIDKILVFIKTIAKQTNLLALNATIEAARAGESGKGFAVVAQEVKTLANQTAEATGDIAAQIENIQTAGGGASTAMDGIHARIKQISEIAPVIASAVEEQSAATSEISGNVQQAAQAAQDVTQNIVQITTVSESTGAASKNALESAQVLSQQAENLRTKVTEFLEELAGT